MLDLNIARTPMGTQPILRRVCSWCQGVLEAGEPNSETTHGACAACREMLITVDPMRTDKAFARAWLIRKNAAQLAYVLFGLPITRLDARDREKVEKEAEITIDQLESYVERGA